MLWQNSLADGENLNLDFWLQTNERYLDFKHKKTWEALWLEDIWNPLSMAAKMAAIAPGTVQLSIFAWNKKLRKYVKDGQSEKAVQHFRQMQWGGMCPDKFTFVQVIKACAGLESLRKLQACSWTNHSKWSQIFVGNSLVDMYAKCWSTEAAWQVFNKMPSWNVVTWNTMISEHVKCGQGQKALDLFQEMQQECVSNLC